MTIFSRAALVVVGHPLESSLNHALAQRVAKAWTALGYRVRFCDLYKEGFDPVMTAEEHRGASAVDPQVTAYIDDLRGAALLAVVHPNCWGAPPAIVKGWIDRVFAPSAAYEFEKGKDAGDAPTGLLTTRAALVLNTSNTLTGREREMFGDPLELIWRRCVLGYCGIGVVERKLFNVVATSSAAERAVWVETAGALAAQLAKIEVTPAAIGT